MKTEEYKDWISKSEDNIKWSIDNLKDENYILVCFLCQQAIEIILKGYCYFKDTVPPKIHDLLKLVTICTKLGLVLDDNQIPEISKVAEYYMHSRYPDMLDPTLDNKDIASEALEIAQKTVKSVKLQIYATNT